MDPMTHPCDERYSIFTYIYHKYQPFMYIGKYASPMDGMGMDKTGKMPLMPLGWIHSGDKRINPRSVGVNIHT